MRAGTWRKVSLQRGAPLSLVLVMAAGTGCSGERTTDAKEPRRTETVEPMAAAGAVMTQEGMRPAKRHAAASPRTAGSGVRLIVIGDRRCKARHCRTKRTVARLKKMLSCVKVQNLDWSQDETRELFEREGLTHLPAYLFTEAIAEHPRYAAMARYLVPTPKGELRKLKVPARHDPRAEICDNGIDDTGNGKVDCDDPGCKEAVVCRPEIPKRLELFVMSQCPYGTKALDSMSEVLGAFDSKIDFRIHFIAKATGDGFKSLHGKDEVEENLREICAIKHYPKGYKYMDYIYCRNRKIRDKNWKACTGKKTGIDARVIARCATGKEGRELLREDIQFAQKLHIASSPTWLANNRHVFHAIAPETIKVSFCKHNPGLKGCEKKLSSKTPVPDGVCR